MVHKSLRTIGLNDKPVVKETQKILKTFGIFNDFNVKLLNLKSSSNFAIIRRLF